MPSRTPSVPAVSRPPSPLQPSRLAIPGALVIALAAFLGAPDRHIAAVECGGISEVLCQEVEVCRASILFLNRCITTYNYWDSLDPT